MTIATNPPSAATTDSSKEPSLKPTQLMSYPARWMESNRLTHMLRYVGSELQVVLPHIQLFLRLPSDEHYLSITPFANICFEGISAFRFNSIFPFSMLLCCLIRSLFRVLLIEEATILSAVQIVDNGREFGTSEQGAIFDVDNNDDDN